MARTYHHGRRKKEKLFGENWQWFKQEPKWWRKCFKHKKRRAEWKRRLQRHMNGEDWDNMVFPMDSRPWIYYW